MVEQNQFTWTLRNHRQDQFLDGYNDWIESRSAPETRCPDPTLPGATSAPRSSPTTWQLFGGIT